MFLRNVFTILLLFSVFVQAQTEMVVLDSLAVDGTAKYEKVTFGLKKEFNSRFIPKIGQEMAAKIENPTNEIGTINKVILHLHKTKKGTHLTPIEISFYEVDENGNPGIKINTDSIILKVEGKNRNRRHIYVRAYKIKFPKEGVFVSVTWLGEKENPFLSIGPSLRLTISSERRLTWHKTNGKWYQYPKGGNAMIDLEVLFPE